MRAKRVWGTLDPFVEPGAVLGRRVANEQFLRFLLRADPFDEYHFFLPSKGLGEHVRAIAGQVAPGLAERNALRTFSRLELPGMLRGTDYHCFHLSDCIASQPHMARLRNLYSRRTFPITGSTHSLSYSGHMTAMLQHLWPGVTPRDCIVATSRTGRDVVRAYFQSLRENLGLDAERFREPRVEIVPLGVDTRAMAPLPPERRAAVRQSLGYGPDMVMVLVFGRVQHHSKMDMLPVVRAFQRLAAGGLGPKRIGLVLAGWADQGDSFHKTLIEIAANAGLRMHVALRPDEAQKRDLFGAADVFCSPADNPQETFGLTILEAAAMGLPVVASEYDGYRDLVIPKETGTLVPTIGPARSEEVDALSRVLFDNQYHLLLGQATAVDVRALAEALAALASNPDLRRAMGSAARLRVEREFSWESVIRRHVALWDDLWASDAGADTAAPHPLHPPYSEIFAATPSARLAPNLNLVWTRAGEAVYREREFPLIYGGISDWVEPRMLRALLFLARKPVTAGDLLARIREAEPGLSQERAEFLLLWTLKQDFLETSGSA